VSRALLHPDLRALRLPQDARVRLTWADGEGVESRGITDTLASIHLLVTAAVHTITDTSTRVTYHPDREPVPVFRDAAAAETYLRQRAVDPSEGGRVCRAALHYLAKRDRSAERAAATPVGATIALF